MKKLLPVIRVIMEVSGFVSEEMVKFTSDVTGLTEEQSRRFLWALATFTAIMAVITTN